MDYDSNTIKYLLAELRKNGKDPTPYILNIKPEDIQEESRPLLEQLQSKCKQDLIKGYFDNDKEKFNVDSAELVHNQIKKVKRSPKSIEDYIKEGLSIYSTVFDVPGSLIGDNLVIETAGMQIKFLKQIFISAKVLMSKYQFDTDADDFTRPLRDKKELLEFLIDYNLYCNALGIVYVMNEEYKRYEGQGETAYRKVLERVSKFLKEDRPQIHLRNIVRFINSSIINAIQTAVYVEPRIKIDGRVKKTLRRQNESFNIEEHRNDILSSILNIQKEKEYEWSLAKMPEKVTYDLYLLHSMYIDQRNETIRKTVNKSNNSNGIPQILEQVDPQEVNLFEELSVEQQVLTNIRAKEMLNEAEQRLTKTEISVFRLMIQEKSVSEIGKELDKKPENIDMHISNIRKKLPDIWNIDRTNRITERARRKNK